MGDGSYDSRSGSRTNNSPANAPIQGRKAGSDPRFDSIAGVFGPTTSAGSAKDKKSPDKLHEDSDQSAATAVRESARLTASVMLDAAQVLDKAFKDTQRTDAGDANKTSVYQFQFDRVYHSVQQTYDIVTHFGARGIHKSFIYQDLATMISDYHGFDILMDAAFQHAKSSGYPIDRAPNLIDNAITAMLVLLDQNDLDTSDPLSQKDLFIRQPEPVGSEQDQTRAAIEANAKAAVDAALSLAGGNDRDASRLSGLVSALSSRLHDLAGNKGDLSPYRKDVEHLAKTIGKVKQELLIGDTKEQVSNMLAWVHGR